MAASSSLPSPLLLLPRTSFFTPISEEEEEEDEGDGETPTKRRETPLHGAAASRLRRSAVDYAGGRPITVPIVDCSSGDPGGSAIRALFASFSCKNSVYSFQSSSDREDGGHDAAHKEASRLREKLAEMEKKIAFLESYSTGLRSALHRCGGGGGLAGVIADPAFPVDEFLRAVTESRAMARHFSRFVVGQIRHAGRSSVLDRISSLLRLDRIGGSVSKTSLVLYLEAMVSWVFYEGFESAGFEQNGSERILDPSARCESSKKVYWDLKGLAWEEVLRRGTKHRSEELSRFCDRKMRELVKALGWAQPWPEPLLQAFFGFAKWVWLVHVLARSVHPMLPIFRVGRGAKFDRVYMEHALAGRTGDEDGPLRVGTMVSPGFYVNGGVVKCKVVCMASRVN